MNELTYYVVIHMPEPVLLHDSIGPIRFQTADAAKKEAGRQPACVAVGYSVLIWDSSKYGLMGHEAFSAKDTGR